MARDGRRMEEERGRRFIFPVIKNSNVSSFRGYYSQSSINYRPPEWLSLSGSFIRGGHYAEVGPKKGRKGRGPGCAKRATRKVFSRTLYLVVSHAPRSLERDRVDSKFRKKRLPTDQPLVLHLFPSLRLIPP